MKNQSGLTCLYPRAIRWRVSVREFSWRKDRRAKLAKVSLKRSKRPWTDRRLTQLLNCSAAKERREKGNERNSSSSINLSLYNQPLGLLTGEDRKEKKKIKRKKKENGWLREVGDNGGLKERRPSGWRGEERRERETFIHLSTGAKTTANGLINRFFPNISAMHGNMGYFGCCHVRRPDTRPPSPPPSGSIFTFCCAINYTY